MVASSIGLGLLFVVYAFLLQSAHFAEGMASRVRLNAEARLGFDMLLRGGLDGGTWVPGLTGSGSWDGVRLNPSGSEIGRLAQKLVIDAGASGTITGTTLSLPIACTAPGSPHADCVDDGTQLVEGYLEAAPVVDAGARNLSVSRHCAIGQQRPATAEVGITLIDPHLLGANEHYIADQYRAEYHNVFALLVDCW